MPENRQVLRNAASNQSGDNIEGCADFPSDWFPLNFVIMIHGLTGSDHHLLVALYCICWKCWIIFAQSILFHL